VFTAENAEGAEKRENQISGIILDAAIAVHTALGPGLLESAYQACLAYEFTSRGLRVQTQVPLPIKYRGVCVDVAYRIDLIVEDLVVIEIKAVERLGANPRGTTALLFEAKRQTPGAFNQLSRITSEGRL
jgi:GxxExxY protein